MQLLSHDKDKPFNRVQVLLTKTKALNSEVGQPRNLSD